MRLDSFGYKSVATFGAGISQLQLYKLLKLNPQEVCVAFDNDASGIVAKNNAIEKLQEADLNISFIKLSDEHNDFGDIQDKDIIDEYIKNRNLIKCLVYSKSQLEI